MIIILSYLFQLAFYAVIILIIVKAVKKNKKRKLTEKYTKRIKELTEVVKSSHAFEIVYDSYLKNASISTDTQTDISTFNGFKNKYCELVKSISNMSKDNTVFFTSQEEWDNFEKLHPNFADQTNIISKDITNTLPLLAEYVLMQAMLEDYIPSVCSKLVDIYMSLLGGLDHLSDEDDGSDKYRQNKKYLDSVLSNIAKMRRVGIWDTIIKEIPPNDKLSGDILEDIYNNNNELIAEWSSAYKVGMLNAIAKKGYIDFYNYYLDFKYDDNRDEEIKNLVWYHNLNKFNSLGIYSSVGEINKKSYNEYMRVYGLYESGKMNGRYSTLKDPESTAD